MTKRWLLPLLFAAAAAQAADPLVERIAGSAEALKKGEYAKALKIDERVIEEMVERLGPGDAEAKWFAVAVTHKALALAGLGREEDAVWYWHVAQNLYPAVADADMSMFAGPAELLKKHPLTEPPADLPRLDKSGTVHAPTVVRRVEPRYPLGARAFGVSGAAIFECIIDKEGTIRDIRLLRGLPAATLSYTAMEALRQWKFAPATVDGKPVDVLFNLTFNFKLR